MTSLIEWIKTITLGPRCPHICGHRAIGWRHLDSHIQREHAGDRLPRTRGGR